MNTKFEKLVSNPISWMYVILVVALLIIVSNNSSTIDDLERKIDRANAKIQASESTVEAQANEIAVRDDTIVGLTSEVEMLDSMLEKQITESQANLNAYTEMKAVADSQNQDLDQVFEILANTKQELSDTKTLLDVCTASQTQ